MNLNFGMNILPSSCYTRKEFRAPPICGMGGARSCVDRIWKLLFYASLWWLTAQDRRLAVAPNVDLWSRMPTYQVGSLGLLRPWNGGSLKNGKQPRLARSGPFSQILSHLCRLHWKCFVPEMWHYLSPTMIGNSALLTRNTPTVLDTTTNDSVYELLARSNYYLK